MLHALDLGVEPRLGGEPETLEPGSNLVRTSFEPGSCVRRPNRTATANLKLSNLVRTSFEPGSCVTRLNRASVANLKLSNLVRTSFEPGSCVTRLNHAS